MKFLVGITVAFLVSTATVADAATPDGDGWISTKPGGSSIDVALVVVDDGMTPGSRTTSAAERYRPFTYEYVPNSSPGIGLEHLCNAANAPFDPTAPDVPWGWWYTVYMRDRATGRLVGEPQLICVPLADRTRITPPPPPALPEPPTIGEIWKAVGLPAPRIATSPTTQGVTGLETRVWVANARPAVTVSVSLDGFTVRGTARVVGYEFDFGDGTPTSTTDAGSAAEPAARHMYETKGDYTLRIAALWRGQFVMTGPGIVSPLPVDLRTAQLTTTRAYPVVEIRSVLVG